MKYLLTFVLGAIFLLYGCTSGGTSATHSATAAVSGDSTLPDGPAYVDFSPAKFAEAQKEGKTIFLEFHASWCPSCAWQEPRIKQAFSSMDRNTFKNVIGFKVDYDNEKELERKYGVVSQHTHVIIKDDQLKLRSYELWSSDQIVEVLKNYV